jgi:hypothetical protein
MTTTLCPSVTEIAELADDYAAEFLASLPLADSGDDLHAALSGTMLAFLSEVIQKAA